MTALLVGCAVPFGVSTLIAEPVNGRTMLLREQFDRSSFAELPRRVPWRNVHDHETPLGWATPRIGDDGLTVEITPLDTSRARDAVEEARAGARVGLSIAFRSDPKRDEWRRASRNRSPDDPPGERTALPLVVRRAAQLVEVSLTAAPCYPTAGITRVVDSRAQWLHETSEQILAPLRAEQAATRDRSQQLKAWAATVTGVPTAEQQRDERRRAVDEAIRWLDDERRQQHGAALAVSTRSAAAVVEQVVDDVELAWRAQQHDDEIVREIKRRGRFLSGAELDAIEQRWR